MFLCFVCLIPTRQSIRICAACQQQIGHLDLVQIDRNRFALLQYGAVTRYLIKSLKGGKFPDTSFWLGERMSSKALAQRALTHESQIIWPPGSNSKKFMDHGYWLAKGFESRGGNILENRLRRKGENPNKALGKEDRKRLEITWEGPQETSSATIWVIDDVMTTGATMKAIEKALGREVFGLALCWKP